MPPRRGGGDDVELGLHDRLIAFLQQDRGDDGGFRRGRSGGGPQQRRGPPSRGARPGDAAAAARQPRPGDWQCKCGFQPNFAHRRNCFSCGKPRAEQTAAGGGRRAAALTGPIGADGLRPQLAWGTAKAPSLAVSGSSAAAAAAAAAPSFRVPGASVAARAGAAAAAGGKRAAGTTTGGAPSASAAGGTAPAAATGATRAKLASSADGDLDTDDDGYQTVMRRAKGRKRGDGGAMLGGTSGGGEDDATMADTSGDHDEAAQDGGGVDAGGEGDEDDATAETPAPNELRRRWQDEIAIVKRLGQQGLPAEHPAMAAACQARDDAEQAWRAAKDPTPLAVRLSRAQAKVDRAIALQAETRAAINELEKGFKSQLAVLEDKLAEDRERVRLRRQQLQQVQAEAGAGGGDDGARAAGRDAARKVHGTLCNELAPALAALVEQVNSDTPAWQMLNGMLAQLASSQQLLREAFEPRQAAEAQEFDIGDDGMHGQDADESASAWSESHDLRPQGDAQGSGDNGWGTWSYPWHETSGDHCMDVEGWWSDSQWKAPTKWMSCGHGKWARTSWADSWEEEHMQDEADGARGAAKFRRQHEPHPTPVAGGAEGTTASGATAEGESEAAAAALRLQQYNARVSSIVEQAISMGIQPLTDEGEELQTLDPRELDAWVAARISGK